MKVFAALLLLTLALPATAQQTAAPSIKAGGVNLTSDPDDVEFCKVLGPVQGKSGWNSELGASDIENNVRKRAAALGGNVVGEYHLECGFIPKGSGKAYFCTTEDLEKQARKLAALVESANRKIACTAGADCEFKWSRAMQWLQTHCAWKFRNVTDTLITTEGPMDTSKPAFEVIKMASGDGKTYQISMRPSCGQGCSEKDYLRLRAAFGDFVLAPPTPSN